MIYQYPRHGNSNCRSSTCPSNDPQPRTSNCRKPGKPIVATHSRELKRNRSDGGQYYAAKAHHTSGQRRKERPQVR